MRRRELYEVQMRPHLAADVELTHVVAMVKSALRCVVRRTTNGQEPVTT
jgi:hypothetical protein